MHPLLMHAFFVCFDNITYTLFDSIAIFLRFGVFHETRSILDNWKCNGCIYNGNCYWRYLCRIGKIIARGILRYHTFPRANHFTQMQYVWIAIRGRIRPCCFHSVSLCLERRNTIFSSSSLCIECAIIQIPGITSSWAKQAYMNFARQWTLPWKQAED